MEKIRELRLERGASIKAVADSLGVSPQAVGKWERGEAYQDTVPRGLANGCHCRP